MQSYVMKVHLYLFLIGSCRCNDKSFEKSERANRRCLLLRVGMQNLLELQNSLLECSTHRSFRLLDLERFMIQSIVTLLTCGSIFFSFPPIPIGWVLENVIFSSLCTHLFCFRQFLFIAACLEVSKMQFCICSSYLFLHSRFFFEQLCYIYVFCFKCVFFDDTVLFSVVFRGVSTLPLHTLLNQSGFSLFLLILVLLISKHCVIDLALSSPTSCTPCSHRCI